jgi:hypothetical protein
VNDGIGDAPDERLDRRRGHSLQDGLVQRAARRTWRLPVGTRQAEHRGVLAQRGELKVGVQGREQPAPGPVACHLSGKLAESPRSTSSPNCASASFDTPGGGTSEPTRARPVMPCS